MNQDAQAFFSIEKPELAFSLYQFFAEQNGSEISLRNLSSQLGAHMQSIRKYIDILELLGLIYIVKNTTDPLKIPNSRSKIYVNAIFENSWARSRKNNLGHAVESYVLERLLAKNSQVSFYRDRNKQIDFLDHSERRVYEVKYRQTIQPTDFEFLIKQAKALKYNPTVITLNQTSSPNPGVTYIPACFL